MYQSATKTLGNFCSVASGSDMWVVLPATCQRRYGVAFQPYHDVIQYVDIFDLMSRLLLDKKVPFDVLSFKLAFCVNTALLNEFLKSVKFLIFSRGKTIRVINYCFRF